MILTPGPLVTDPLTVAVVSVSLTLIVGVVVGIVTAALARRGEHAKWMRERRYEAYVAFMIDMAVFQDMTTQTPNAKNAEQLVERLGKFSEKFVASFEAVSLLGPRRVNAAGQLWVGAAIALRQGTITPGEYGDARWKFLIVSGSVLKSKNVGKTPPPTWAELSSSSKSL